MRLIYQWGCGDDWVDKGVFCTCADEGGFLRGREMDWPRNAQVISGLVQRMVFGVSVGGGGGSRGL